MSINPRDYDLDELRRMARERGGGVGDGEDPGVDLGPVGGSGGESASRGSLREGLYRELLPLQGEVEKPYLRELPDRYAGEHLLFEWLEFLVEAAGYRGATAALDYYESIGWLTPEAESTLHDYLLGLDGAGGDGELDVDDHLLSLVYIAKLAGMAE
jgi:flagellar protein FlaE